MVVVGRVIAVVVDSLCPAKFIKERLSLVLIQVLTGPVYPGRVAIVGGSISRKHMGSLVAHVANFRGDGIGELVLNGDVPRVHGGVPHFFGTETGAHSNKPV